ncbi:exportin-T-like [Halichondria panicea]|uniref:exportin-T-like n=1 Tax=Halichondria panicea TaxID=6063 RepID=UPI00312BB68D
MIMEDRLLVGLGQNCTQEQRQLTIVYFEELKNSPNGWKMCAEDFTQKLHSDDHVRFFCLQMIESHVKTGHASSSDDDILALRKVLLLWMQDHQRIFREDARFLKSKIAQIFALTFIVDYPLKWPTFFSDLLEIVESGDVWSVELYLRILLAIDSEVVDRQIVHTQEENARNTDIKDHMRAHCVLGLVESWLQIMTVFEEKDHGVVCLALEVAGAYVSWVDVNLIANDRCISLLLKYLSVSTLRESAVDTLHEIISKGMDPPAKIKLVESLCKILESVGVLGTSSNQEEEDPDFQGKLSKFVNGMGCALVTSWNKLLKAEDEANAREALIAIDRKLPYLHRFLSDEDDGVSETVIEFAVQYIGVLKQRSNLSDNDRLQLQSLLRAVVNKLKYDEDYNFDSEGEEEIMFIDYRKQLKVLFDNIAQLDPYMVLQSTDAMLSSVLSNMTSEPFMNIELVLRVFHMIGEVIASKQYGAVNVSGSIWHKMMTTVLQSSAGCHDHTAVLLQYYEIVVRYDKFFQVETQYIPPILEGFLGVHGLRHRNSAVRSRLSYLLVRFIKSLKSQLGGIAEQVLTNLRELLLMLPGTPNYSTYLSTNDMMFMYEIAGILIVFSQQTPEAKGALMAGVISPLVDKYQQYILQITKVEDLAEQEELAKALYNLISFASRASKAFPNHQQAKQNGCVQCFAEPLSVFLRGLEVGVQRDTLQSGVRQYLHRMIICLGDELLKYVPMAVSLLLKDCKSRDIQEFIPLVNQLIVKYKQLVAPILQEVFFPVCQHILTCIDLPCDPSDLNVRIHACSEQWYT